MSKYFQIWAAAVLCCCTCVSATARLSWPEQPADTVPHISIFRKLGNNIDSLMNRRYRDSVLKHLSRANMPPPAENNSMTKSEESFKPYSGKVIRNIYFTQLKIFGPRNINDTAFHSSMKLIRFANRLHYNTRLWAIRQSLFFHEQDTVNAYELADNERYLRNRPFIEDARIYIRDTTRDSVDVLVITKDVFEYGGDIFRLNTAAAGARVYNKNLFGAAQSLQTGFLWHNDYHPPWNAEVMYTKYNVAGSFADVYAGYTTLNNNSPLDTGVYEGSYYLNIQRPLYTSSASLAGGITLSSNYSININNFPDSLYRHYNYGIFDIWAGYNFRSRFKKDGSVSKQPGLAVLLRQYNLFFQRRPSQEIFHDDPVYNNRRYILGQFVVFKQDFFKTTRFFGFGRTEDIPLGYSAALSLGTENYVGERRHYTGLQFQQYLPTKHQGLTDIQLGISSFWEGERSQDAVIHAGINYYSKLLSLKWGYVRQFFTIDYLNCPNPFFNKPLNINMENGVYGYKRTSLGGYQRLNIRSLSTYYSALKVYGFRFNFFASIQASQLSTVYRDLFRNPVYTGIGVGCLIRNENLPVNILRLAVNYFPGAPKGLHPLLFELSTTTDIRFDIYALRAPSFLSFL